MTDKRETREWEIKHECSLTIGEFPLRLELQASDWKWRVSLVAGSPDTKTITLREGSAEGHEEAMQRCCDAARDIVGKIVTDLGEEWNG